MSNIIDYLEDYSNKTFEQHPFTAVDALLLTQISYMKLKKIVPKEAFISFEDVVSSELSESMYVDRLYGDMYKEIMEHIVGSKRFLGFKMGLFHETYSDIGEYQFAAVTIKMPNFKGLGNRYFVSFRGTDERLAGWKEDLNIGYMGVIPSQLMAKEYLESITTMIEALGESPDYPLFIGGHSKGGAQAVYAASMANDSIRERICGVYSFDGVGMGDDFYQSKEYQRIKPMVTKIIPDESIVGMLFENQKNCLIIESDSHGIKQHEYINWLIKDGQFIYCEELKPVASILNQRLKQWMESMNMAEREDFIDIIYGIILDCKPEDIYNMGEEIPSRIKSIIGSIRTMTKEERDDMIGALKKLI